MEKSQGARKPRVPSLPLAWVDDGAFSEGLERAGGLCVEPRRRVPGMRKASSRFHRSARGYGSSTPQPRGPCQEASVEKASQAAVGRA